MLASRLKTGLVAKSVMLSKRASGAPIGATRNFCFFRPRDRRFEWHWSSMPMSGGPGAGAGGVNGAGAAAGAEGAAAGKVFHHATVFYRPRPRVLPWIIFFIALHYSAWTVTRAAVKVSELSKRERVEWNKLHDELRAQQGTSNPPRNLGSTENEPRRHQELPLGITQDEARQLIHAEIEKTYDVYPKPE